MINFLGLMIIILAVVILKYKKTIYMSIGHLGAVESWFPGGTWGFLNLFPIIMIVFGFILLFGLGNNLLSTITDPITPDRAP
ncbi:hypothetical protein KA531_02035 [Candidatus Saccharibacteria bacterium]|nr:hypothetical protein [Candidatus Saccharibacteria bacterium]